MPQDGFVQAGGTPDPSEQQRQDQKASDHFMKEVGVEKEAEAWNLGKTRGMELP